MSEPQHILLEALLVVRCQAGDDAAFERLYERYEQRLLYYLRRLLGVSGSAEDAAQAVWLSAYRNIKRLDEPRAFRAWLYRIAHNRAMSELRTAGREVSWEENAGDTRDRPVDKSADTLLEAADVAALHAGLERLSAPHRAVLTLRFLHEMSYDEIAEITEVGVGTVRSRLHHAKQALRRHLEDMESSYPKGARR